MDHFETEDRQEKQQEEMRETKMTQDERQTVVLDSSKKKKMPAWGKGLIILGVIILCTIFLTVGCNRLVDNFVGEFYNDTTNEVTTNFGYSYIGTIYVQDTIDENGTGLYNHQYLLNAIDSMMEDNDNKGMILYINTPGGSVFASDELYFKIK